jgi:alkanesulfonate monooxygenase SsuD/methylene tetrahydromethanopterin reductase-like flavin-dependent oxidoreductase (luciferase family)
VSPDASARPTGKHATLSDFPKSERAACTPLKQNIPISVLDLSPILKGSTPAQAFRNTLDLARHAERWGYKRYWLFTSLQQQWINRRRGTAGPLNPPLASTEGLWSDLEQRGLAHAQRESIVGSPEKVQRGLAAFIETTGVDELPVTGQIFDHAARLRSFEIVAEVATQSPETVNA